jgi:hypothetical protein
VFVCDIIVVWIFTLIFFFEKRLKFSVWQKRRARQIGSEQKRAAT